MTTQRHLLTTKPYGTIPIVYVNTKQIVPVYKPDNVFKYFVPEAGVKDVVIGDRMFQSAPLALNRPINLLDISASGNLIEAGYQHPTDVLDAPVMLENLYIHIPQEGDSGNIIRLDITHMYMANEAHPVENSARHRHLDMTIPRLLLSTTTQNIKGRPLQGKLGELLVQHQVLLAVSVKGLINGQTSTVEIFDPQITFENAFGVDKLGDISPENHRALQQLFSKAWICAFDIQAYRTNSGKPESDKETIRG